MDTAHQDNQTTAPTRLDGSYLEGGGQILRNGLSYSALLGKPLTIFNIRKNRSTPGLRNQHLSGFRLVNEISQGKLLGDSVGSEEISFFPGLLLNARKERFFADAFTAGSITLMIQASLPVLLFCPLDENDLKMKQIVVLQGGTNVSTSPSVDYICNIFRPMFSRLFCGGQDHFSIHVNRRGYFPRGNGKVTLEVKSFNPGETLQPITLVDRGVVVRIKGYIYTAGKLDISVAKEIKTHVLNILGKSEYGHLETLDQDIEIVHEEYRFGAGSGVELWAETSTGCIIGGNSLGDRKKSLESTTKEACEFLLENLGHGGCVDEYLQDMLIIFMALAKGRSKVITGPLSQHTMTAFHTAEKMTGVEFNFIKLSETIEIESPSEKQERYLVECEGIGYTTR